MIKKSKKILFTVLLIAAGMLLMVLAAGLVLQMKTEKPEEILRAYFFPQWKKRIMNPCIRWWIRIR